MSTTTTNDAPVPTVVPPAMVVHGVVGVLAWFGLFGLGLFINSAQYRDPLVAGFDWHDFTMSLLTYTPTNVGALCLAAAFVGGCSSRMQAHHTAHTRRSHAAAARAAGGAVGGEEPTESDLYRSESPVASLLRGFVVYGTYMAGSFIASDKPFSATSPELYARAAGATSLAAFTVGFDPTFLYSLIGMKGKGGEKKT